MSIALSARPVRPVRPARPATAARGAAPVSRDWDAAFAPYLIDEVRWGFRVRSRSGEPPLQRAAQALAMTVGAAAAAAAAALLWPLLAGAAGETMGLRVGLAALIGGGGLLLLWFASRGTLVEAEVDTAKGEVRLMVRNHVGRPTLLGRHGFDTVAGVSVVRDFGGRGLSILSLELAGRPSVPLASGSEGALAPLRRRLERELLIGVAAIGPAAGRPFADLDLVAA